MKIFAIRNEEDENRKDLGYLIYYEKPRRFYIELPDDADPWEHSVFWTLAGQVMSFKSYENEKTNKNRNSYDFCNCYTDVSLWKPICFSKSMCTKGNVMAEHGNSR